METNKVNVKIYGQEYVIAGDKPREEIIQVAAHVDMKMQEIGEAAKSLGASPSNIAVLSAVNIASEYFEVLEEIEELKRLNLQLEKDAQHYLKMWDEAKKSFTQYKESAAKTNQEKKEAEERFRKLQEKCSEFENSFFDLQMENIRLKSELDKYRRTDE